MCVTVEFGMAVRRSSMSSAPSEGGTLLAPSEGGTLLAPSEEGALPAPEVGVVDCSSMMTAV